MKCHKEVGFQLSRELECLADLEAHDHLMIITELFGGFSPRQAVSTSGGIFSIFFSAYGTYLVLFMFERVASNLIIRDWCSSLDSPGNQLYGFGHEVTYSLSFCFLIHKNEEMILFILL